MPSILNRKEKRKEQMQENLQEEEGGVRGSQGVNMQSQDAAVAEGAYTPVAEGLSPQRNESLLEYVAKVAPSDLSIIRVFDSLLEYGFKARASDIHIEPTEDSLVVRFRIDGVMHDVFTFPASLQPLLISRIKIMAGMRTDEHQASQDGRFKFSFPGESADVRVSIVPTYYGENAVLRLLTESARNLTLEQLGFSAEDLKKVQSHLQKPFGMILVTGPTGSGKTTTLYSFIKILNTREVSIATIEDPVEYSIEGINQIQVNVQTELTFAKGLRAILRQDPNTIMVGEIRDEETADIAVNAALTGHLVLSTLHTNDASITLPRLLDMGVEPFLVASTVNVAIGQRLVRKLCPQCKESFTIGDKELSTLRESIRPEIVDDHRTFFRGRGCDACESTGYRGRIGIYEVLEMKEDIRRLIMAKADADVIRAAALKSGMTAMLEDGFLKAVQGVTTIEEVLRVIRE